MSLAAAIISGVVTVAGLVFKIWKQRQDVKAVEAKLASAEATIKLQSKELARSKTNESILRSLVAQKEIRIRELETQLAAVDAGALLDDIFGVRGDEPSGGDTGPSTK